MSTANGNPSCTSLKVLLIDEHPIRRTILEAVLRDAGLTDAVRLETTSGLERARPILMQARGSPAEQAYAAIRSTALNDEKHRIAEVAGAVVTVSELLE
jgi:AmiR/NasT family two-component response regulator